MSFNKGSVGSGGGSFNQSIAPSSKPKSSKHHHGLFGAVGHVVAQTGRDLVSAAEQAPGGVAAIGKAAAQDFYGGAKFGFTGKGKPPHHVLDIIEGTGKQTARDLWHPLRRPGYTAMDLAALFSLGAGTASRVGAAGRALEEGAGARAAVTRAGSEGGSLLHRPQPGTVELVPGVRKPLTRNAALRPLQRKHYERVARKYAEGKPATRLAEKTGMSAESIVGRQLRAQRRIEADIASAPSGEIGLHLRGLKKAEHGALAVVGIEGKAALENPAGVIARHIAKHEEWIKRLKFDLERAGSGGIFGRKRPAQAQFYADAVKRTESHIKDLKAAQKVLENPRDRFVKAVQTISRAANDSEAEAVRQGLYTAKQVAARKEKIASLYGGHADELSFYFPLSQHYTNFFRKSFPARAYSPGIGQTGLAKPIPGTYVKGYGKEFTGESVKLGGVGNRVGHHIMDVINRRNRFFSARDFYNNLESYSSKEKRSPDQIPIPESKGVGRELKSALAEAENQDVFNEANATDWQTRLHEILNPKRIVYKGTEVRHGDIPVGETVPGYRWVDRRLIKDINVTGPVGQYERVANALNRPVRFATVYARPAYIINKFQNWTMLAFTEGARFPQVMKRAGNVLKEFDPKDVAVIDHGVGTTRTASYIAERARVGRITKSVEQFWQDITDQRERRAAFFGEAERAGYHSTEQIRDLLHSKDPAVEADRLEVFQRARKNIVDFDSMTPSERQLAVAIYFYPWMTRGSAWAIHAAVEHPAKVAALGNLGTSQHEKIIGKNQLPKFLEGAIPIEVGGKTYIINPTSVNTFQTATEIGKDIMGTGKGALGLGAGQYNLSSLLSPTAALVLSGAGGSGDTAIGGLAGQAQSLAPVAALRRAGALQWAGGIGKMPKTYPYPSIEQAVGPLLLGGLYPRRANLKPKAKKGQRRSNSFNH